MSENPAEDTRNLFNTITKNDKTWTPSRQMIANVFNAYPTRALTLNQIDGVARVMECLSEDCTLEADLKYYVRKKVLRVRKGYSKGPRLFEVNY